MCRGRPGVVTPCTVCGTRCSGHGDTYVQAPGVGPKSCQRRCSCRMWASYLGVWYISCGSTPPGLTGVAELLLWLLLPNGLVYMGGMAVCSAGLCWTGPRLSPWTCRIEAGIFPSHGKGLAYYCAHCFIFSSATFSLPQGKGFEVFHAIGFLLRR